MCIDSYAAPSHMEVDVPAPSHMEVDIPAPSQFFQHRSPTRQMKTTPKNNTANLIDSGLYDVVIKLLSARDLFDEHPVRDVCSMDVYLTLTYVIPKSVTSTLFCVSQEKLST